MKDNNQFNIKILVVDNDSTLRLGLVNLIKEIDDDQLEIFEANCQESINASGGDATRSDGTVAYSLGQVVYTSSSGSNGSVAQGVQHAYEIFTFGIKETALNISLTAFPNPTTENLTILISDYNNEKLSYKLIDMEEKKLSMGQIVAQQTQIDMNSLPAATYFINVVDQENKKI